jgi:G3E family GTPase
MTRRVVELLVEMVECADIVLLNKMDRLSAEQTEMLQAMVAELNSTAVIQPCSFGKVKL